MNKQSQLSRRLILSGALLGFPLVARAQGSLLDQGKSLLGGFTSGGTTGGGMTGGAGTRLNDGEIGRGLKEALKLASQKAVGRVGKFNGFNGDPAIRIPLPGPLQQIESPLKAVGASGMLDDLQIKMNRAAEQAAPKALNIFIDAISKMSISDARGILTGPKDAATQYFRRTTSNALTTSFRPIVDRTLSSVGAVRALQSVQAKASNIPFAGDRAKSFSLTDFTVAKALDGLFHYMATEEEAIRSNPAARTTDILKKVFG